MKSGEAIEESGSFNRVTDEPSRSGNGQTAVGITERVIDLRDTGRRQSRRRVARTPRVATPDLVRATKRAVRLGQLTSVGMFLADAVFLIVAAEIAGARQPAEFTFAALVLIGCCVTRAYRERISPTIGEEVPVLVARVAVPALIVGAFLTDGSDVQAVLHASLIAASLMFVGRLAAYALVRRARRSGVWREPTLIVGAGQQAMVVARTLHQHPEYGLVPVGFVDNVDDDLDPPIVGNANELDALLEGGWIRRIIVAFGSTRESYLVGILRAAEHHGVEVHVLPRFFELGVVPLAGYTDVIWGIPLSQVRRSALRRSARRSKRVLDVIVAFLALLLLAPAMMVIAILVKLTSPGPVLFRQTRVGQRGHPVEIYKFRTLPVNNDADRTWSVEHDPRVGRVGRFLRRSSLDELPQFVNVLRGDMSIVGPRPERPAFVDEFDRRIPRYGDRHRVPVGMTGWAQVHRLRGDTSIEERARFDNFYIENWSLWRDLLIIVRTLPTMVLRPGAPRRNIAPAPVKSSADESRSADEELPCSS